MKQRLEFIIIPVKQRIHHLFINGRQATFEGKPDFPSYTKAENRIRRELGKFRKNATEFTLIAEKEVEDE